MVLLGVMGLIALGAKDNPVRAEQNNDAFCGRYQTTEVTFRNTSAHTTYDLVWDGAFIGELRPGETKHGTTSAGHHRLDFKFPNSDRAAYSADDTVLASCTTVTFTCDRDE